MQIKINEHNLHYDDFGEGTVVVLIHGFAGATLRRVDDGATVWGTFFTRGSLLPSKPEGLRAFALDIDHLPKPIDPDDLIAIADDTRAVELLERVKADARIGDINVEIYGALVDLMEQAGYGDCMGIPTAITDLDAPPCLTFFYDWRQDNVGNAIALGVKETCPECTVDIRWINTWHDPQIEREAAASLFDAGAQVVFTGADTPAPAAVAEELGLDYVFWGTVRGKGSSARAKISVAGPKGRTIASRQAGPPGTSAGNTRIQKATRALLAKAIATVPPQAAAKELQDEPAAEPEAVVPVTPPVEQAPAAESVVELEKPVAIEVEAPTPFAPYGP